MAKAEPKQGGPRNVASEQLDGALRHRAHLRNQRAMYIGTKHGTAQSVRGSRIRRNPDVPPKPQGSGGITRGGRYRG